MRTLPHGGLVLTPHARKRCQQRCISPEAVNVLYQYGRCKHVREGAQSFAMDQRARLSLQGELGRHRYKELEPQLDAYIIVKSERYVTTVAIRKRRLRI